MEAEEEPFVVVVSDLQMPEMNGIDFLKAVRERSPDTTRILLTGNADLSSAVSAVNEGNIFRFLTKPCPNEVLIQAVSAGVEQHRLVTGERVLLERTLHGCVTMLTEILALANPSAFGRAARVKQRTGEVAAQLGEPARWQMEMAAMLSQAAAITLPGETVEKMSRREELTASEQEMVDRLPQISEDLIADIPRLDEVRAILRHQNRHCEGTSESGEQPIGARILRAVVDLDAAESEGLPPVAALEALNQRAGWYDPEVLGTLGDCLETSRVGEIVDMQVSELRSGLVLLDAVESSDGRLLVARGQEVSVGLLERLRNFARNVGVKEPLRILVPS